MIALLFLIAAAAAPEGDVEVDGGKVDMVALKQQKQAAEEKFTGDIRDLVVSICGGRCELLSVDAELHEKKEVHDKMPGFEKMAKVDKQYVVDKATVRIAADSKLSPSSKSGLIRAIKGKLADAAPAIDVQMQPFDWPTPRAEAPTPIVLTTQNEDKKTEAPPLAPVHEPTPKEKLLLAFAAAAPWLLGLLVLLLFIALFISMWKKPEPVTAVTVDEEDKRQTPLAPPAPLLSSPLLDECKQNNTLKLALFRRALREAPPETVAQYMRCLDTDKLPEFHDGALAARLAEAYRCLRALPAVAQSADTVVALERLWLQVSPDTTPDARFAPLLLLDARQFYLLCEPLSDEERAALLLLAPSDLRESYFAGLAVSRRQTLIADSLHAAQALREPRLSVLAQKLDALLASAQTAVRVQDRAVMLLQQELMQLDAAAQAQYLERLRHDENWQALVDRAVVTEDDLLALDAAALSNFIVSLPPEALCTFVVSATSATKDRVVPLLPRYLRPIYDEELARAPSEESITAARRAVFGALLSLKLARGPVNTNVKLVAVQ